MKTEPVRISFDNQQADLLAAERLYYRHSVWSKLDKLVAIMLFAVGVFSVWGAGPAWWTLIWFPLAAAEWFNLLSLKGLWVRYSFKRNPKFHETYRLSFSHDGIGFKTASIDSTIRWSHYTRALENESLFLLIYGSRMYTVVPKRAFADPSEIDSFREIVSRNIPAGLSGS